MATVEGNREFWNTKYDWQQSGEEWSGPWGNSEAQWWNCLRPRIHNFVPCDSALEIAPGFGRWTVYLKDLCRRLTVVDLSPVCIENCRKRFADCSQIAYAVNDGKSLAMIPDRSLDFAFSFDSLVHAEADVLEAYVGELAKKLKPNGVALVHHSNALRYQRHFAWVARLPRGRGFLARQGLLIDDCGRAHSMSALLFETYCRQAGVCCVSQEIINWSGRHLIDCISVFTPKGSIWERPNRVLENPGFVAEARRTAALAPLYTQAGFPGLRHPPAA